VPEPASQSDPLIRQLGEAVDHHHLLAPGSRLVVGVSGGLDSVCLLDALVSLAAEDGRGYELIVAHLDHALRIESQEDAQWVADLAGRYGLRCDVERRDVAELAAQTNDCIEAAGRAARYEFFEQLAEAVGADRVAVAHHADDNIETILHRLFRGTHLRGLIGMPMDRAMSAGRVRLIRPLLQTRRDEIAAYARSHRLQWREDPTNADRQFDRNFIRHELLPLLRQRMNPQVNEALQRLSGSAEQAEEHLGHLGRTVAEASRLAGCDPHTVRLDMGMLAGESPVIRTYALRLILEDLSVPMGQVTAGHLHQLAELFEPDGPTAVPLPGGLIARREDVQVTIGPPDRGAPAADTDPIPLAMDTETALPDGATMTVRLESLDRAAWEAHCSRPKAGEEFLDADAIRGPLMVRRRRDGDVFRPLGAPGSQSVSDFLTNAKLPAARRRAVWCVCDNDGIVYLAPLRIDQRVKVTDATTRVCHVVVQTPL
jgi:tRNA(Ile)-lysidine synthase